MGKQTIESGIKVLLVGAGQGGKALLNMFLGDPSITVTGVADIDENAPGLIIAKRANIPTDSDFRNLILDNSMDLIVDVTGDPGVHESLQQLKPRQVELIGAASAGFIKALVSALKQKEILEEKYDLMLRELEVQSKGEFIIGADPRMQEIADLIVKVAPTRVTVLINGETGTGKEVIARAIHRQSDLKDSPLVTVNCTAFSPNLIESELFGYKKGAFTGAFTDRIGIMEEAHDGTVFLDEIGDMPTEMQAKLLRFLQTGEIRPVGDTTTRKVQVRVIAATNRNLEEAIAKGQFRADLFYRLNAFIINLPPLRDRTEDIPLMTYHFLRNAQVKVNKRVSKISAAALSALTEYQWPGNLRELENVIEHAVVLTSSDEIDIDHLPINLQSDSDEFIDAKSLNDGLIALKEKMIDKCERNAIYHYLSESKGNVSRASSAAKVSRRTFQRLIAKHGITRSIFQQD